MPKEKVTLPILYYTVKYYGLESRVRLRRDEKDVRLLNTQTNLTIGHLDPGITYSVAVSATSTSGPGEFCEEITVGCKYGTIC